MEILILLNGFKKPNGLNRAAITNHENNICNNSMSFTVVLSTCCLYCQYLEWLYLMDFEYLLCWIGWVQKLIWAYWYEICPIILCFANLLICSWWNLAQYQSLMHQHNLGKIWLLLSGGMINAVVTNTPNLLMKKIQPFGTLKHWELYLGLVMFCILAQCLSKIMLFLSVDATNIYGC